MRNRLLPILLVLSLIACCIEVDVSVPSFPDMCRYFGVSQGYIQLTIAYNFAGFCIAALFCGPLSECFGRRKVMIIGNGIMLIGAIGCVIAPAINVLLLVRFIQGLGASTSAVIAFAMIADNYQGKKSTALIGMMNAALTIMMATAPIAGTFINNLWGWRGNYAFVALVCFVSWLLLFWKLPETKNDLEKFNIKTIWQNYQKLLSSKPFTIASLIPSFLYSTYMCFIASSAFLYIETLNTTITAYALHQGFIIGCFAIVSIYSGKIIEYCGKRMCIIGGISGQHSWYYCVCC